MNQELQKRNQVWNMAKEIIKQNGLKIGYAFLDPINDEFGNFIEGDITTFREKYDKTINEVKHILPNNYVIARTHIISNDHVKQITKATIALKKQ